MTGAELMGVVGFFIMLSGALWAIWWRIEGRVDKAKNEAIARADSARTDALIRAEGAMALATLTRTELQEHRLYIAENYVTKNGLRDTTETIMEAIHGVKSAIDGVAMRVDRVFEVQGKTTRTRP